MTFNPRRLTTVLYYLNLWIYHRSLLVIIILCSSIQYILINIRMGHLNFTMMMAFAVWRKLRECDSAT